MYEISKERLLQIAKDSPRSSVKINQWYPELFKIEAKWIQEGWHQFDNAYVYVKDKESDCSYGFYNGEWRDAIWYSMPNLNRSDINDIKSLIINEAIRREYNRDNIICLGDMDVSEGFNNDENNWSFYRNVLYTESEGDGGVIAYKNGVWASKRVL